MFGNYEETEVIDLDQVFEGDDSVWEAPSRAGLAPGKYQLRLASFEAKNNADTGSKGFYFYFYPYADENGVPVPAFASEKMKLRKYFYIGKMVAGKLVANGFTNNFTEFLISVGVPNTPGGRKFSNDSLSGVLVTAVLELGEKKLSTREDPATGKVPEVMTDDPNTYVQFLQIKDDAPIRGLRDASGQVQKVYA